jgi:hypothetical protein
MQVTKGLPDQPFLAVSRHCPRDRPTRYDHPQPAPAQLVFNGGDGKPLAGTLPATASPAQYGLVLLRPVKA